MKKKTSKIIKKDQNLFKSQKIPKKLKVFKKTHMLALKEKKSAILLVLPFQDISL